jgi:hypothetical protein
VTNLELLALAVLQRSQQMKRQRQRLVVALLIGSGILAAALITALAPKGERW